MTYRGGNTGTPNKVSSQKQQRIRQLQQEITARQKRIKGIQQEIEDRQRRIGRLQRGLRERDGCFIATAVTGSKTSWQVKTLRQFRDNILVQSEIGLSFVEWYYCWSPTIAYKLALNPQHRRWVYWLVTIASAAIRPIT